MNILAISKLAKYGELKADELTVDVVKDIVNTLGLQIHVSDDVITNIVKAMAEDSIDTVADLLNNPGTFTKIANFMKPEGQTFVLYKICEYCGQPNRYEVKL